MKTKSKGDFIIESERANFSAFMAKNTNYFGNFPGLGFDPVFEMLSNKSYESLCSIGYNPDKEEMQATINVNRPKGYGGDLCTNGSLQHLRFFLNYNDGQGFIDQGSVGINVHDIPYSQDCSGNSIFPLTYSATLKRKTLKSAFCKTPILPKMRVILSWNMASPENNANWKPTWGDVMDCNIQIKPVVKLNWELFEIDYSKYLNLAKKAPHLTGTQISKISNIELPEITKNKNNFITSDYLKKFVDSNSEDQQRVLFKPLNKMIEFPLSPITLLNQQLLSKYKVDYSKFIDNYVFEIPADKTKANVDYEELECVGLNYHTETLVATIKIKRPNGYSGNLCSQGSKEYISFWIDWKDECEWTYLQTAEIEAHDIVMDSEDLCYSVSIPIDAKYFRKDCKEANLIKVRAVLSWNKRPSTVDPNKLEFYGNRVDSHVQIKPGTVLKPGDVVPSFYLLCGVSVDSIGMNSGLTTEVSQVNESTYRCEVGAPFGGRILLKGNYFKNEEYSIELRSITESTNFESIVNDFEIPNNPTGQTITQKAINGFYPYIEEFGHGLLADLGSRENGLYEIKLKIKGILGSFKKKIRIYNDRPIAKIDVEDDGDCRKFAIGETIPTKITVEDSYLSYWTLKSTWGDVIASGNGNQNDFPIDVITTDKSPCGEISLKVWNKTILNSQSVRKYNADEKIICLQPNV